MSKKATSGRHRAGKKMSKQHTTVIKAAGWIVDAALRIPEVTKVSLGVIKPARGGQLRLKLTSVHGGFKVQVRGQSAIQMLMVYTSDPTSTSLKLQEVFAKKSGVRLK